MNKIKSLYLMLIVLFTGFINALLTGNHSVFAEVVPEYKSDALATADAGLRANYDVKDVIFKDNEDVSVFTRLGLKAMRERANGVKVTYFEQYNKKRKFTPAEDQAHSQTTVKFAEADAKMLVPGMEFKIVTETVPGARTVRFIVVSIGATALGVTTVNITPFGAATLIAVVAASDKFLLVGMIKKQGAPRPTALNNLLIEKTTYTRIFDASIDITGSLISQRLYGETERNRQKQIMFFDHALDIESAMYNAGPAVDPTIANGKMGTSEGMIYGILNESENVYIEAGNTVPGYDGYTLKKHKAYLNKLGSVKNVQGKHKVKTSACNGAMINVYNELAEDKIVTMREVSNQILGIEGVQEVRIGQIRLYIFESQQMNDIYPADDLPAELDIDHNFLEVRPYRDTKLLANVQDNGADNIQDMVRTELAWILSMKNKHGMFVPKGAY